MYFLILSNFFKNGSPEQTTMLMRRAAKLCVEPWSPFSEISHQESKTIGKPPIIVSWPECQVTAAATAAAVSQELSPFGLALGVSRAGTKYPVRGIPHFDDGSYLWYSARAASNPMFGE